MSKIDVPILHNAQSALLADIPRLSVEAFRQYVCGAVCQGSRLTAFFGYPAEPPALRLMAVLAHDALGTLSACATDISGTSYPALTPECPQAHWFEREIAEQWAVRPEGHPWLKPIRSHAPYRGQTDVWGRPADAAPPPAVTDFYRVEGEEIHEVAVGPVHAGIIEPGHFRFQCHGENVCHLEISLGYQHRGVERALIGGPNARTIHYAETLAGDTTAGHGTAYAQSIEALTECPVPARGHAWRAIALELERLANHTGDMGALAGDVGYLPTASYCGRLRGDFLNLTAMLCGNRFGRGMIRPGGVAWDLEDRNISDFLQRLEAIRKDTVNAVELLWKTASVLARFEDTGRVRETDARALGLVGPAARACGIERDVRVDFPAGLYRFAHIPAATWPSGDVFARALVRWIEMQRSMAFIAEQAKCLPEGACHTETGAPRPLRLAVSLVEGWRGEICHVAVTDERGRFAAYKVCDPSFHNWMGLAMALRDQPVSDFPLCNKSFNLSYCGHDL